MSDILLDVCGLARVCLRSPSRWLADAVEGRLGRFMIADDAGARADIVISGMSNAEESFETLCVLPGPQHRLGCVVGRRGRGVFLLHRERPDVGIFPGAAVEIFYEERPGAWRRIYAMILFALDLALRSKSGLLFHGACLARGDRTALVGGQRASGKTLLALSLLRRGWGYVADDKLLLHGGEAHLFEPEILLRDHHVRKLSWLRDALPPDIRKGKSRPLLACRGLAARLGAGVLSKRDLTRWEQKWNRTYAAAAKELFPDVQIYEKRRPDAVIHLRPSDCLSSRTLSMAELVAKFASVQRMVFQELAPLEDLVASFCQPRVPAREGILEGNLAGAACLEFDVPVAGEFDQIAGAFEQCLEQA
ncbi:MAG: hypothetical protein J7M08_07990 [Planctomycetes bacterium]|nr:hypothetical protein [Planctomycetota bacterium]